MDISLLINLVGNKGFNSQFKATREVISPMPSLLNTLRRKTLADMDYINALNQVAMPLHSVSGPLRALDR